MCAFIDHVNPELNRLPQIIDTFIKLLKVVHTPTILERSAVPPGKGAISKNRRRFPVKMPLPVLELHGSGRISMTSRKTTDWMWAQASDLLDQAERMHRRLFHLASPRLEYVIWEPPVDVFENGHELIVVVALPGVPNDKVEVLYESGELLIRADCPIPFASTRGAVCRLEIPYGRFERRIHLPAVSYESARRESRDGYLIIHFDKVTED